MDSKEPSQNHGKNPASLRASVTGRRQSAASSVASSHSDMGHENPHNDTTERDSNLQDDIEYGDEQLDDENNKAATRHHGDGGGGGPKKPISTESRYTDEEDDLQASAMAAAAVADPLENLQDYSEVNESDFAEAMQFLNGSTSSIMTGDGGDNNNSSGMSGFTLPERFQSELDKLQKLLSQSRRNEAALMKKCREVTGELSASAAKVQAALRMSRRDRSAVTALKKEVEKAWKLVEVAREKEKRSKEAFDKLKTEGGSGQPPVGSHSRAESPHHEQGAENVHRKSFAPAPAAAGLDSFLAEESMLAVVTKQKQELAEQLAQAQEEISRLNLDNQDYRERINTLNLDLQHNEASQDTLKELLASKKVEAQHDRTHRQQLESSVKSQAETISKREAELAARNTDLVKAKDSITRLEQGMKDERSRVDKEIREKEALSQKLARVQGELEEERLVVERLRSSMEEKGGAVKDWESEFYKYKDEIRGVIRIKDSLEKRVRSLDEANNNLINELQDMKSRNQTLTLEHESMSHQLTDYQKHLETLVRDRDISQKNFIKATAATLKQQNLVKLSDQTKRNLEQEIASYKDEASKMRKLIYSLEKDRDRHINESHKFETECNAALEELKIKDNMIFDSKKKIADLERKLKEQQALYENVRADRNLYSKNLIETQDEITEMKRKLKIMGHQIEQLKEEIAMKDSDLAKKQFELQKLEKDKEGQSTQIAKLQQQHGELQQTVQNRLAEESKLHHIIAEGDTERQKQKKAYEALMQERDILGTQLIRRNDELSLLYEKIRIQMSTLNKGEIQYRERQEDIRVLKLEIKKLRREKAILQTETQNLDGLRNEIFRLQREILKERTRVKVLEEELESPMNIHRWRKLSGSDPSTFELITKIQALQKRLITKTEEVVEKEMLIAQKEKMYKEVKDVLQRQPGPEVLEELRAVKDLVKVKVRESKSLASEMNMYHSQVNEYKYEIERLNHDLQELKKRYYEAKKRDREEKRQQEKTLQQPPLQHHLPGHNVPPHHQARKLLQSTRSHPPKYVSPSKTPQKPEGKVVPLPNGIDGEGGHYVVMSRNSVSAPTTPPKSVITGDNNTLPSLRSQVA